MKRIFIYFLLITLDVYLFSGISHAQDLDSEWTLVQRRLDGSVDFFRNWEDYKNGFGSAEGEYFIGLEKLHIITKQTHNELLITMEDWSKNATTKWANYDNFRVSGEDDKYKLLELGNYSGNAGDAMSRHRGCRFSTKDQDNDYWLHGNCAAQYWGAWWFRKCYHSHLNGPYLLSSLTESQKKGIIWVPWHGHGYSLRSVEMKIRPTKM